MSSSLTLLNPSAFSRAAAGSPRAIALATSALIQDTDPTRLHQLGLASSDLASIARACHDGDAEAMEALHELARDLACSRIPLEDQLELIQELDRLGFSVDFDQASFEAARSPSAIGWLGASCSRWNCALVWISLGQHGFPEGAPPAAFLDQAAEALGQGRSHRPEAHANHLAPPSWQAALLSASLEIDERFPLEDCLGWGAEHPDAFGARLALLETASAWLASDPSRADHEALGAGSFLALGFRLEDQALLTRLAELAPGWICESSHFESDPSDPKRPAPHGFFFHPTGRGGLHLLAPLESDAQRPLRVSFFDLASAWSSSALAGAPESFCESSAMMAQKLLGSAGDPPSPGGTFILALADLYHRHVSRAHPEDDLTSLRARAEAASLQRESLRSTPSAPKIASRVKV